MSASRLAVRCNLQMVSRGYLSVCAMFSKDTRLPCVLCLACEAWSTHSDHVGIHVVTLFGFRLITFEGISFNFIRTLQKDQASSNTGKV